MAEVLITLGIIGVVAALTIPCIINKFEKHKTLNILKRAYRDLYVYVKDFDYINDCSGSLANCTPAENEFMNNFSQYLISKHHFVKITKNTHTSTFLTYKKGESAFNCLVGATPRIYLKSPSGYAYGITINSTDISNSIFRGSYPNNYTRDPFRAMIWIFTDVNKLENKKARLGFDMFNAFVMQSEDIIPNGSKLCGTGQPPYGWTYYCGDWKIQNLCDELSSSQNSTGYGCLSRIIEEGWQIKYR